MGQGGKQGLILPRQQPGTTFDNVFQTLQIRPRGPKGNCFAVAEIYCTEPRCVRKNHNCAACQSEALQQVPGLPKLLKDLQYMKDCEAKGIQHGMGAPEIRVII